MCLIAWNWQPDHDNRLLLLANRDEYYARPTLPLHWWADGRVLAGKDLQGDGTWLGVTRDGRLAALTNYRQHPIPTAPRPSRGGLVLGFLEGQDSAADYLEKIRPQAAAFNPFNLLVFDGQQLLGLESRQARLVPMAPGMGAVSNADFHTPWPKLRHLREHLQQRIARGETAHHQLWPLLQHGQPATDSELPSTGVPLALERALSSTFIAMPDYGTRASSIVQIGRKTLSFAEQTYTAAGPAGQVSFEASLSG